VQKIYRGKWILPARFLVRAKVFQLMGGGSIGLLLGAVGMVRSCVWLGGCLGVWVGGWVGGWGVGVGVGVGVGGGVGVFVAVGVGARVG
jgi:hypothetical protein